MWVHHYHDGVPSFWVPENHPWRSPENRRIYRSEASMLPLPWHRKLLHGSRLWASVAAGGNPYFIVKQPGIGKKQQRLIGVTRIVKLYRINMCSQNFLKTWIVCLIHTSRYIRRQLSAIWQKEIPETADVSLTMGMGWDMHWGSSLRSYYGEELRRVALPCHFFCENGTEP